MADENVVEEIVAEEDPFVANGITFDGLHSYTDFSLWLLMRPDKGSPAPKLSTVSVPGMDGILDLTGANTGSVKFANRTMVFTFGAKVDREDQAAFEAKINDALHGRQIDQIILDDEPGWYYSGRATVRFTDKKSWKLKCIVTVDAAPYAMKLTETVVSLISGPNDYTKQLVPYGTDDSQPTVYPGGIKSYRNTAINIENGIEFDGGDECLVVRKLLKGTSVFPEASQNITIYGSTPSVGEAPAYQIYRPDWDIRQGSVAQGYMFDVYIPLADIEDGALPGGGTTDAVDASDITRIFVSGLYRCEAYAEETVAKIVIRNNSRKAVIPVFDLDAQGAKTIYFGGKQYIVPVYGAPGVRSTVFPDIVLQQGDNEIFIKDDLVVTNSFDIRFREGRL